MQGKGTLVIYHGMAGVAAALIPHHHVIMAGEVVHHAAFSLIAPVNTNDCTVRHIHCLPRFLCSSCTVWIYFFNRSIIEWFFP